MLFLNNYDSQQNYIMNRINLYWFQKKGAYGNFGDELGPYIIQKLSGMKIYQIPIPRSSLKLVLAYLKGLLFGIYSLGIVRKVFKTLVLNGRYIISVGSIIGWGSGKRIVWGSGILFEDEKIDDGEFLAVRGKYTQERLRALGYRVPEVIGDPALLLPLLYKPDVTKKYELGFIPHHTQYEYFNKLLKNTEIKVINLLNDIEVVLVEILECKSIISTSLHGLIVPHAYNIPALWYEYKDIQWHGENIKFWDYFSSVDIPLYEPIPIKGIGSFQAEIIKKSFKEYKKHALIVNDLNIIQRNLLRVAPFKIKDNLL